MTSRPTVRAPRALSSCLSVRVIGGVLAGLACSLVLGLAPVGATAREAAPLAADPALEARVLQLADELRCLVCQNETLAASQADLAIDLRQQIRVRLQKGETDAQIVGFMVERYGEFVRYRPTFSATTALLWLGPFALLAVAALGLATHLRRRARSALPAPLDAAERQRAQALLASLPSGAAEAGR